MNSQQISTRWKRFLLTGCDSGFYHAEGCKPTPEKAASILDAFSASGPDAIGHILGFSDARPEAALFALALAASPRFAPADTVSRALAALPLLARKGHELAAFAGYASSMRGWGRSLRTAIAAWYSAQPAGAFAAQLLRRPNRNLSQHRSLMRRAHPKPVDAAQSALFQWISAGRPGHLATSSVLSGELALLDGFTRVQRASSEAEAIRCIEDYRLQPPHLPAQWKKSARVWEALFDHLNYRQLLRYLPAMTASGLLSRGSDYTAIAVARLANYPRLRASAVNPLRIAQAMRDYRTTAVRPVESIFDALDEAFHLSLRNGRFAGERVIAAIDATGSMQGAPVLGMRRVPASLAGAALLMTLAQAPGSKCAPLAFHRETRELKRFGKGARLADALNEVRATPSRSDPAGVIRYAASNRMPADALVIITDRVTPPDAVALAHEFEGYRQRLGLDPRLILVTLSGGSAAGWDESVTNENGHRTLTVAGLDSRHALTAISAFAAGV